MSTFIQLAQALRQEAGISGEGPVTVVSQKGEMKRVCDWISRAWVDVQEDQPDWAWMRKTVSFNTTAAKGEYAPVADLSLSDFGSWRKGSFRLYLTSAGVQNEFRLEQIGYEAFRDYYLLGSRRVTNARPIHCAVSPDLKLLLGMAPDDVYTVTGEYYKTPVVMTADADVPDMPTRFHMAIVYRAMMSYGAFEASPDVYTHGEKEYRKMLNRLRIDQAPMIQLGGGLI